MKNHPKILIILSIVTLMSQISLTTPVLAAQNKVYDQSVEDAKNLAAQIYHEEKQADEAQEKEIELTEYHKYKLAEQADQLASETNNLREKLRYLTVFCMIVGAIIALFLVLFRIKHTTYGPDDILNATGLIFIIFGTIIVVIIADVDQQLTAAVGILGAIAGYLFGTLQKPKEK